MLPYAIVRASPLRPTLRDAHRRPLQAIDAAGLSLLVGPTARPSPDAESYMDAVTRIHETMPCVPMRLGPPIDDADAGRRLLESGSDRFHRLLDLFAGVDEWSVTVRPTQGRLDAPAPRTPPTDGESGRAYLDRRRLEADLAAGMDAQVSGVLADLARRWAPHASLVRTVAWDHGGGSLVLLLDRAADPVRIFRSTTEGIALPATLTGPWPPFSFTGPG